MTPDKPLDLPLFMLFKIDLIHCNLHYRSFLLLSIHHTITNVLLVRVLFPYLSSFSFIEINRNDALAFTNVTHVTPFLSFLASWRRLYLYSSTPPSLFLCFFLYGLRNNFLRFLLPYLICCFIPF